MSSTIERAAIKALAEKITEQLFTDSMGELVDRLVLTDDKGKDLGGLCYDVVRERIERQLRGKS